jgi:hypothetical protein
MEFFYGCCGGFVGIIVSHPFDTIKSRIQSGKVKTIKDAIQMKKLYSGISPPLMGMMLEKSIVFGFYNKSKEIGLNDFWSGIIGGFMSTLIVTPVDYFKIYFQNREQNVEWRRMYRGFLPTVCRETPGFGIYFSTYEYLKNYNKDKDLVKTFLSGALSGLNAWIFIYPSDLVKTKMQSSNITMIEIIKNIYKENNRGFLNFYKGFSLAVMRAMPLHGGVFLGYEMSKKFSKLY